MAIYNIISLHVLATSSRLGAAVVGDTLFVPSVVSQLPYNPLCMFRYIDSLLPPNEWENVSLRMTL